MKRNTAGKILLFISSLTTAAALTLFPLQEGSAAPLSKTVTNDKKDVAVAKGAPDKVARTATAGQYKEGELLVKFKASVSEASKAAKHRKMQATVLREHKSLRLQRLALKKGMSVQEALAQYKSDPDVAYAEPNYQLSLLNTPNDPDFDQQWGLAKISAPTAWDITTGNGSPVIAILDTGIDYTHPDLVGNLWVNQGEVNGAPGVDNDGDGYPNDIYGYNAVANTGDPMDDHYHGTHVAGIIGAVGNNGAGVSGVAWNAKLMACKFMDASGSGYVSDAIECLQYVKTMKSRGVNIVATSNSWGNTIYSQSLYDAIKAQEDILFVAAAGNDNSSEAFYPSGYDLPNIVSVAASDENDAKASFSNYNKWTADIAAPGNNILSTYPGEKYATASGTSMAAPHVSGLAALLSSQDSSRSAPVLKNLILAGGDTAAAFADITVTGKRVNAYSSLTCSNSPLFGVLHAPLAPQAGVPQTISALSINCGTPVGPVSVTLSGGTVIQLQDDGVAPDEVAGDGIFTGSWTPASSAVETLTFSSPLGSSQLSSPPVTINVPPTVLASETLLPGSVTSAATNVPFSQSFGTSGGLPPFSWSLVGGSLPAGLTFNAQSGEIAGTPSAAGVFTVTVQVADSLGVKDRKEWTLLLNDGIRLGWPKELHQRVGSGSLPESYSPVVADLFGDGKDAIVAVDPPVSLILGAKSTLYVFYPDGTSKSTELPGKATSPVVADLFGDGRKEIIVTVGEFYTDTNSIYAFHADLTPVTGFPAGGYPTYNHGPGFVSTPVVADFNNDGQQEIAVLTSPNNYSDSNFNKNIAVMVDNTGHMMPGWPQTFGTYMNAYSGGSFPDDLPPAAGDLDQDGKKELVFASGDGYVRIFRPDGTLSNQWPFDTASLSSYSAVLADMDGDGYLDVVVKYQTEADGNVIGVFDRNGTPLPGWPKVLTGFTPSPTGAIVADVDGDGHPEIVSVAGYYWNELDVLKGDGSHLAGWPVQFDGQGLYDCYPVVADLDGDGKQEVLVTGTDSANNGQVLGFTAAGLPLSGFPKNTSPGIDLRSTAAIGDIDGNGKLDLVAKSENGFLWVWEMPQAPAVKSLQWPMYRNDQQHSGALLAPQLQISPATYNFGKVLAGTSSTAATFAIGNPLAGSATISGVSLSGADSSQFTLTSGSCGSFPVTLGSQQSCTVNVTFSPAVRGAKTATLTAASGTQGVSSGVAQLTGTGSLPPVTLTYSKNGSGNGTVTSSTGTAYNDSGSEQVEGETVVTLTASAAPNSKFSGWTGCDSVSGAVCTVTMSGPKSVSAAFDVKTFNVTATVTGGSGAITPASALVNYGDSLTVTVTPSGTGYVASFQDNGSAATLTPGSGNTFTYPLANITADHALSVTFAVPHDAVAVAAGEYHTIALLSDGTVWSWGSNQNGELGDGTNTSRATPAQVPGLAGITAVAAGSTFSLALKADGTVWAWGANNYGQLGDGSTTARTSPVQVQGVSGVTAISGGAYHALARKSDGTVWAWGENNIGQIGDNSFTNRLSAVQVPGLTGVSAVAAGGWHSVALKADGTLWAWGYNGFGQVGDGSLINRYTPTKAVTTGVTSCAAGFYHTEAVKSDGTVWGWGFNGYGQLGNGSTSDMVYIPVKAKGIAGARAVTAGIYFSAILKEDGTVWSWGDNGSGNLGDGSGVQQLSPVQVSQLSGVTSLAAGWYHATAVKADHTAWAWGANGNGQLGDGSYTGRTTRSLVQGLGAPVIPFASISGTPVTPINSTAATLTIGGDGVVSYQYSLDGGAYSAETPVATPITLSSLADGTHVVAVIGKNSSGSWQSAPTTTGWAVDVTPPTATIGGIPAGPVKSGSATLTIGGNGVSWYQYRLDNGSYSATTSVHTQIALNGLSEGYHTVEVIGRDNAGNWQVTPTTVTWLVDLTAPVTSAAPDSGMILKGRTVTLSCSDGSGSGCASTRYCLGTGCTPTTSYGDPIVINAGTDLRFYSTDSVGNSEAVKTVTYTLAPSYQVNLTMAGAGNGTVTSSPAGLSASASSWASFDIGATVTLHAEPGAYSLFGGWSGACSGSGDCVLTMTADRAPTATFTIDSAHSTYNPGSATYSTSVQAALDTAADSDVVRLWGVQFNENLLFSKQEKVTLSGGYDPAYSTQSGKTILHGSLRITAGTVKVDGLAIR